MHLRISRYHKKQQNSCQFGKEQFCKYRNFIDNISQILCLPRGVMHRNWSEFCSFCSCMYFTLYTTGTCILRIEILHMVRQKIEGKTNKHTNTKREAGKEVLGHITMSTCNQVQFHSILKNTSSSKIRHMVFHSRQWGHLVSNIYNKC